MSFGYYICTHVRNILEVNMLKRCIESIKKIDQDAEIIVINDNSPKKFILDTNITVVKNDIPKSGEIYPYYYNYLTKKFDTFVVLHDSMVLKKPLPKVIDNIVPLWHFESCCRAYYDINNEMVEILTDYPIPQVYEDYLNNANRCGRGCGCPDCKKGLTKDPQNVDRVWTGVFGISCIITKSFNDILFEKYYLKDLIHKINTKPKRCCLERIFGILIKMELNITSKQCSLNGNIFAHPYSFSEIPITLSLNDVLTHYQNYNSYGIKSWHGR